MTAKEIRIELSSDRVLAADLVPAIPELGALDGTAELSYAPLPGVERRVRRTELLRWTRTLGLHLDPDALPGSLILARKMRRISTEEIRKAVTAAVATRYHVDPARVAIEFHSFSEPLLPDEDIQFELGSALVQLGRLVTLSVRWTGASGASGSLSLRATARVQGSYAVAREDLERGVEVSASDFMLIDGDLPGDPTEYQVSVQDLDSQQLNQSIKAGATLEKRMLRPALTVKRGDLIEIRVAARGVVLRAPARAEDSGSSGDVIRCRNLQSMTTVRAVIVNSRQAEVVAYP